ncbi:PAS domain-containing protein [Paraburkholderia sp. SARCC-3016]|uniref:PAS domain-containing protein n=1 Tax=Paraburkholderia sp. SARCC-3016 TaxID=3058611 RepID=UPI002807BD16|nr:PAS domain-containing protein [Paraburkholderia sp. SARCC-3016]MDQ7976871.1 PAS domain-containing protein [Paraburkholderia sp. SARCC-3016]
MDNEAVWPFRTEATRYVAATCFVAVSFACAYWLSQHFVSAAATMSLCAIVLSAWLGGIGPGAWAVVVSLVAFDYGFVQPLHSLHVDPTDLPRMMMFSFTATFIGCLGALQHRTARSLREAHRRLARTVSMLTSTNAALQRENAEYLRVAEQLRLSSAFLAEGQKISRTGSWRWNIRSATLVWSEEHYRILGYTPAATPPDFDMIRRRIHPSDREMVRDIVRRAVEANSAFECEYRIVLPDGTIRHMFGTGRPLSYEDGRIVEYIGTTVDVSARKRTEDLLRKSEKAFRTLAENLPDSVVRYNRYCERIYVNPAFERKLHLSARQVLNAPLRETWMCDIAVEDYEAIVRRVLTSGEPDEVSGIWTVAGGSRTYNSVRIAAERDADGEIVSAIAISRDVTEAKLAEMRVEESRHLIRQLAGRSEAAREEERKHLARELHDGLAQSLLAVRMQLSVLSLEFGADMPALTKRVNSIVGHVDGAIKVVRNAVTSLRPVALDLGILPALEWLVQEFTAESGIPCKFNTDLSTVALRECETTALFRIAQEALRNIMRHARATRACLLFKREAEGLLLEIRDDGIGFDATKKKPTSFGLVGIRERVLMFAGTFDLLTSPGTGTTLRIRIPATGSSEAS